MRLISRYGAFALLALLALMGCSQPEAAAPTPTPKPAEEVPAPPKTETAEKPEPTGSEAVKAAIEKAMASEEGKLFPKGTRIQSVTITEKVATIDLSKEFRDIDKLGDSAESEAQKRLLASLQDTQGVDKVRVTVEGEPFQSQMADWGEPMDVRATPDDDKSEEKL